MILQVLRLTGWEWFKLRRRWMPWILLAPLVIIPQIWLWGEYFAYRAVNFYEKPSLYFVASEDAQFKEDVVSEEGVVAFSCADIDDGTAAAKLASLPEKYRQDGIDFLARIREPRRHGDRIVTICEESLEEDSRGRVWHSQVFVLPIGLANGLAVAQFVGIILILILASSSMGSEYGLGTLRAVLVRGVDRWRFLASKALLLTLVTAAALVIALVPLAVSGVVATSLVPDGLELAEPGDWSTVFVMFGKVLYALLPYIALALFLAVLTSSTTFGIAIAIGYIFAEGIVISFLGTRFDRFDWFQNVLDFMLGPGAAGWLMETGVRATGQDAAFFPLDKVQSNFRAFFVILAYIAALGGGALWLIQRKDIAGSRGE